MSVDLLQFVQSSEHIGEFLGHTHSQECSLVIVDDTNISDNYPFFSTDIFFLRLNCTWADGLIQTSMPMMMMMHKLQQSAVYNWLQGGGSDHLQWSGGIRLYNRISSVHSAIPCVVMLFSVCGVSLLMRCWLGMREQGPRSANHLLPHHNEEGDIRRK